MSFAALSQYLNSTIVGTSDMQIPVGPVKFPSINSAHPLPLSLTEDKLVESDIYYEAWNKTSLTIDFLELSKLFSFENQFAILSFVLKHYFLKDALKEAQTAINSVFGEYEYELSLELDIDPEEGFEVLFITIKTGLTPEQSIKLLNRFDRIYWLKINSNIRNILEVTVGFL